MIVPPSPVPPSPYCTSWPASCAPCPFHSQVCMNSIISFCTHIYFCNCIFILPTTRSLPSTRAAFSPLRIFHRHFWLLTSSPPRMPSFCHSFQPNTSSQPPAANITLYKGQHGNLVTLQRFA